MEYWAKPRMARDQMVLFSPTLDASISDDHPVRLLDELLHGLDWSAWEVEYDGRKGQPPIPPWVMAGVLLYGLMRGSAQSDVGVPLRTQRGLHVVGGGANHRPYDPLQVPHAVSRALEGFVPAIGETVVADGVDPLGRGGLRWDAGEGQCQPFAHLDSGAVGSRLERIGRPV